MKLIKFNNDNSSITRALAGTSGGKLTIMLGNVVKKVFGYLAHALGLDWISLSLCE
jgi:hypothetical protein